VGLNFNSSTGICDRILPLLCVGRHLSYSLGGVRLQTMQVESFGEGVRTGMLYGDVVCFAAGSEEDNGTRNLVLTLDTYL